MSDFAVKIILSASSPIPDYDVAPWDLGTLEASSGDATTGDSYGLLVDCSPVGEYADIAQGGNYVAVDSWTVSLHAVTPGGAKWWDAILAAGASMYGARVELWDVTADLCRAVGTVTDAVLSGMEVRIECESILTARHKVIPARTLTAQEFPTLQKDVDGAVVPIMYGSTSRTTPPSLLSEQNDRIALTITNTDNAATEMEDRSSTWVASGSGVGAVAATYCPVVASINSSGGTPGIQSPSHWLYDLIAGRAVYMRVLSGTGSGQDRKILSIDGGGQYYSYTEEPGGNVASAGFGWIGCNLAAPFDTLPDLTSVIAFFVEEIGAVLAVADECSVSRVYSEKEGAEYSLAFTPSTPSVGVIAADISSEFKSGEDYAALNYYRPSVVYGVAALSDGLTKSGKHAATYLARTSNKHSDALCRAKLYLDTVPSRVITSGPEIYLLVSVDAISATKTLWAQFIGQRYDNTNDVICQDLSNNIGIGESAVNCFSPAILPDGISGAFSAYALKIPPLPMPLEKYRSFRFGIMVRDSIVPPDPMNCGGVTWTNGGTSVIVDLFSVSSPPTPQIGDWIRPDDQVSPKPTSEYYRDRFFFGSSHVGAHQDWRQITNVTTLSFQRWQLDFADPITCPTDSYNSILVPNTSMTTADEYECGIAFVHSSIPKDDTFLVDVASGRTFSASWPTIPSGTAIGDPITLARDAAMDMLYRDLSLGSGDVDFASFQALPSNGISAALVEAERSDNVIARMSKEFNWIVAHDGAGKERAKTWLNRLWTTEYDYEVANAHIVGDSMQERTTAIEDVICQPSLSWDWTQADGFRSSAIVTDITVDAMLLTSSNYLHTISGFGDFSRSLDTFTILQAAYSSSMERGESDLEWRYGGDALALYVDSRRMWWAACRKRILDFRIPETHAAMSSAVGDRIKVTHRRATAGSAVYGTLAGRWWHPIDGTVQLLLILDPGTIAEGILYVDTIDPSGVVPLYTDMADGTTEQYIDQTGA